MPKRSESQRQRDARPTRGRMGLGWDYIAAQLLAQHGDSTYVAVESNTFERPLEWRGARQTDIRQKRAHCYEKPDAGTRAHAFPVDLFPTIRGPGPRRTHAATSRQAIALITS